MLSSDFCLTATDNEQLKLDMRSLIQRQIISRPSKFTQIIFTVKNHTHDNGTTFAGYVWQLEIGVHV